MGLLTEPREVRHRTRGRAEKHVGGGMLLNALSIAELLVLPGAVEVRQSVDANTPVDYDLREEHIDLVTALVMRVRLVAANNNRKETR